MARYDYRCSANHLTDTFRPMSCDSIECPKCGATANRIISSGASITHKTADTRGLYRRFTEASQEIDHAASQRESAGETVNIPNNWAIAKEFSKAVERRGEVQEVRH